MSDQRNPHRGSRGGSLSSGLHLQSAALAGLARRLLGEPNPAFSTTRELRWGRRGSFSLRPERGVWFDHEAGIGGGAVDLAIHLGHARTRAQAAELLQSDGVAVISEAPREAARRRAEADRAVSRRRGVAAAIWRAGGPLTATAAEAYLRAARGVVGPLGAGELRFLSHAPLTPYRPDGRTAPALVARVADVGGRLIGAHLTYLQLDGSGKADLPSPRKMVGSMSGGAVCVRPGSGGALVAEGLESAFSAADTLDAAHEAVSARVAVVAALSAHGLATLPLQTNWRELVIAPDRDPSATGELAARRLAERAWTAGLNVRFMLPPEGCSDWNDAARRRGGRT